MSEKSKTRKNKWMVSLVDVIQNEQVGYISELDFCEKYKISIGQFTRWVMKTPLHIIAGFNNVYYNEEQLVANIPKIKSTQ